MTTYIVIDGSSLCNTADGKCSNATGLPLAGVLDVLDELFSYSGPLGGLYSNEAVSLFLRAPTARNPLEIVQLEEDNGVWSTKGPNGWEGCYMCMKYLFTILAPRKMKNAMPMIHMLEGMLVVFCSSKVIQK